MSNYDDILNNSPAGGQSGGQLSKEDFAAKKKAERDDVYALADNTALAVAGDGGKFQQYLDMQSKFGRYSAVNTLLIMAQKPEATRVADFDKWKERGGSVRGGATSFAILESKEYAKDDGSPAIGYDVKKVFDISQVDTRKMEAPPPQPTYTDRQILQALISKAPMKISGIDSLSGDLGAYTDHDTGEIFVRKGMEFADTFRSVAQELCYSAVEHDGSNTTDPTFTAHSAAYILCKKNGIDTHKFDFKDAPRMFEGFEAKDVKQELSAIRDAADSVAERMAKQLDAVQKAARSEDAR